jgi:hypothetical protein
MAAWLLLGLAVVGVPLALWLSESPFVGETWGKDAQLFEFFGFSATAALLAVAVARARCLRQASPQELLQALLPLAVGLYWAGAFSEFSQALDWEAYHRAASAMAGGRSLYSDQTALYLYPPLTAEALGAAHGLVERALHFFGSPGGDQHSWRIVYYLFQCGQFALILALYRMLCAVAHRSGLRGVRADGLVAVLLVVNNPLFRTFRWGQVNLYVLDLALAGVLLARPAPALAGLAIALAIHIKLYPLILVVPLVVTKCWRAVVWTVVSVLGLGLTEAAAAGLGNWRDFLALMARFPHFTAFRSNSVMSIVSNSAKLVLGLDAAAVSRVAEVVAFQAAVISLVWFLWRMVIRERRYREVSAVDEASDRFRLAAHAADALAFALLVSPVAWEHHFVLCLPLIVFAVATALDRQPLLVGMAATLVVGTPTFDIFPLSYVRLLGLVLLLVATDPRKLAAVPAAATCRPPDGPGLAV